MLNSKQFLVISQFVLNKLRTYWIEPIVSSTPDLRKRPGKPTVSPKDTAAKKPEVKRLKAFTKKEEWVEVPTTKNLRKKKPY